MKTRETQHLLQAGIRAARAGDKAKARQLLLQVTEQDPMRTEGWLWLAGVTEDDEEIRAYLQTALALDPGNRQAQEGLRWLERRSPQPPRPDAQPQPERQPRLDPSGELPPRFILSVEQAEAIDRWLERMAYESEARCIILADVSGQLIAERGQTARMNTQVLSALAAGELAATQEMARLVGEEARFKLLLHEGQEQSVYLSDVGKQLILVIVFDNDTPIGLVRMVLKQAVEELAPLLEGAAVGPDGRAEPTLGADFAQMLEDELNASWQ